MVLLPSVQCIFYLHCLAFYCVAYNYVDLCCCFSDIPAQDGGKWLASCERVLSLAVSSAAQRFCGNMGVVQLAKGLSNQEPGWEQSGYEEVAMVVPQVARSALVLSQEGGELQGAMRLLLQDVDP